MEALLQKYNEGLEESSNILDKTDKSISSAEIHETGLTHLSRIAYAVIMFRPEEEIEFRVKMVPKATRNITLQITTRGKGMPKPILL